MIVQAWPTNWINFVVFAALFFGCFLLTYSKDTTKPPFQSHYLPDYETLLVVYPGDSGTDLLTVIAGSRTMDKELVVTDGLRLSYMLNQLDGHHIPKDNSQGAFIGRDKKVYIYDLKALKTYLTKKYGDPLTTSSMLEVTGQSGIMMLNVSQTDRSAGSVGLWDGSQMYQIKDYTKAPSVKTVTFWKTRGCTPSEELSECRFYKCLDSMVRGEDNYALAYGYRYCQRFADVYSDFNSAGKKLADDVRRCLMKALSPLYKGVHSLDAIKRIAFDSHVGCYVQSGNICKMASDLVNLDALFKVYEPSNNELWKTEDRSAWEHVLDSVRYCNKELSGIAMDNLKQFIKRGHDKMRQSTFLKHQDVGSKTSVVQTGSPSACLGYADSGDCRFYQCFQKRFPCNVFGVSHMTDFEFPVCLDLETQNELFELEGQQWMKATNQCLMRKLLPLFDRSSISCIDLHDVMFRDRLDCLLDAGFCGVTDTTANRWAIDRAVDIMTYPVELPDKSGLSTTGREYFFSELTSLRRLMGYANYVCYNKGLKNHATFYARVLTPSGYKLVEQN